MASFIPLINSFNKTETAFFPMHGVFPKDIPFSQIKNKYNLQEKILC